MVLERDSVVRYLKNFLDKDVTNKNKIKKPALLGGLLNVLVKKIL